MNENEQTLQSMVEYYRNKCHKLEHDFLIYKIGAEKAIRDITEKQVQSESSTQEKTD